MEPHTSELAPFRLTSTQIARSAWTVAVEGELDLHTVPELEQDLASLPPEATHVLVDLMDVTFVDSTTLALLHRTSRKLAGAGGLLVLACDQPDVLRAFETTGLDRRLVIHRRAHEAARQLLGAALLGPLDGGPQPAL